MRSRIAIATACVLSLVACGAQDNVPDRDTEIALQFPQAGQTYLYWDQAHGYQVEYLGKADGWLWYPGNAKAVHESWSIVQAGGRRYICLVTPPDTFDPVLNLPGGEKQCQPLDLVREAVVAALPGDVFDLSSGQVPYRLKRDSPPSEFGRVDRLPM